MKGVLKFSETLPGKDWEPIQTLRQQSDDPALFDRRVYESFAITEKDLARPHMWDKFSDCFYHFMDLFDDKKFYKAFIKNALLQLINEDNVQYIELRDRPPEKDLVLMYKEIVQEIQEEASFFGLRLIFDAHRRKDHQSVNV